MTQLEEIKKVIDGMPPAVQIQISTIADVFRRAMERSPATGPLALALVGAELSENYDKAEAAAGATEVPSA